MQRFNYNAPTSFWGNLASFLENSAASLITLLLIPALLAVALLLPPVSLLQRIRSLTLTEIDERGATIADPDGTVITFPGELVQTPFRAAVSSIPRANFLAGEAGEEWRTAADALPNNLTPRSPLYEIDLRGEAPMGMVLQIPIPNDSEPYETLDLYTWSESQWRHLPSTVIRADDRIESQLQGEIADELCGRAVQRSAAARRCRSRPGRANATECGKCRRHYGRGGSLLAR